MEPAEEAQQDERAVDPQVRRLPHPRRRRKQQRQRGVAQQVELDAVHPLEVLLIRIGRVEQSRKSRLGPRHLRSDERRHALEGHADAGASAWDGMLAVRMVAADGAQLRAALVAVLEHLDVAPPRVWSI
jgi:hypothetical protein